MNFHSRSSRLAGLVQDFGRHPRLAHVVQQRGHSEIVELDLGEAQLLAQRHREDADVDRVSEGVLVVVPHRGHADHGHFVVEHLVDHQLDRPLHPLEAGAPAQADAAHHVPGDGDALRIDPLGLVSVLLRAPPSAWARSTSRWVTLAASSRSWSTSSRSSVCPCWLRLSSEAEEDLPLSPLHPGPDVQDPDLEGPQHGEDVAEGCVVVELDPQAGCALTKRKSPAIRISSSTSRSGAARGRRHPDRRATSAPWRSRPDTS